MPVIEFKVRAKGPTVSKRILSIIFSLHVVISIRFYLFFDQFYWLGIIDTLWNKFLHIVPPAFYLFFIIRPKITWIELINLFRQIITEWSWIKLSFELHSAIHFTLSISCQNKEPDENEKEATKEGNGPTYKPLTE